MNRNSVNSGVALVLVGVGFLVFTLLNNQLFSAVRLDLTENKLFTLSDSSKQIVAKIDEPINLYFFFSEGSSRDLTGLRAYAKQVRELLMEYELAAGGKINLQIIDPAPFSEDEDKAAEFGLQSVPVNTAGEALYFGLAGTNATNEQVVIPFFQPDKEAFLEYEISKMVQNLVVTEKPVVGLLSTIKVQSDLNMQTFQNTPAWLFVDQIEQLFDIENVDVNSDKISSDIDLLILIHPKDLADTTLYGIDQFVMKGGKLLVFIDPLAEQDRPASANPMMPGPQPMPSDLNKLLHAWGIGLMPDVVLADSQTALSVSAGPSGQPVRHLGILGMGTDNFSQEDVTTSGLESINFASAGILEIVKNDTTPSVTPLITPLIQSSAFAQPIATIRLQTLTDPADLQADFTPTGEIYMVAARLSGPAVSAFKDGLAGQEDETYVGSTTDLNIVVIADTDMLADHMWVQVQDFFGQRIASPWANNADFVTNTVDNLVGSSELISIRSRGRFSRPFDVVQDLRRQAEEKYLASAEDLQVQLAETERQLSALESTQGDQLLASLSPEQEAALEEFLEEKLRIRKQLRDVRRQLDQDIESLGSKLKFLNIALVPILLTLMLLMVNYIRLSKRSANES